MVFRRKLKALLPASRIFKAKLRALDELEAKIRAGRPPNTLEAHDHGLHYNYYCEMSDLNQDRRLLITENYRRLVEGLSMPMPDPSDKGLWEEVESGITQQSELCLSRAGEHAAIAIIRESKRHRRETVTAWFTALTGLSGTLIGIVALVVSVLTYFSTVETKDSLLFRLVESDMTEDGGKAVSAKFVFSNGGNLPYLISQVQISISFGDDPGKSYPSDSRGLVQGPPFLLAKGEMRVLDTITSVIDISPAVPQPLAAYLIANITAVDVDGQVHKSEIIFASTCIRSGMLIGGDAKPQRVSLSGGFKDGYRSNPCLE